MVTDDKADRKSKEGQTMPNVSLVAQLLRAGGIFICRLCGLEKEHKKFG